MLPVDIDINTVADVPKQGVEVNALLEGLTRAENPMNIIILDACRDNPFGNVKGVDQKGLSQMDAPNNSLLAYATAPGNVASDGEGENGLYTENFLREMKVKEAKIEEVFKRVRLNVRLKSKGAQVPWESTSLEEDFWFQPPGSLAVIAQEEVERRRKEEQAAREKRFAEEDAERRRRQEQALREARLAAEEAERKRREEQVLREARLAEEEAARRRKQELAEAEKRRAQEDEERRRRQSAGPGPVRLSDAEKLRLLDEEAAIWDKAKSSKDVKLIEAYLQRYPSGSFSEIAQLELDRALARQGEKKVEIINDATNPFTKGSANADTNYRMGESYTFRVVDRTSRVEQSQFTRKITAITEDEVRFDDGTIFDLLGNVIQFADGRHTKGVRTIPLEYSVGKRWSDRFVLTFNGTRSPVESERVIVTRERITVPAGTFNAFRIQGRSFNQSPKGLIERRTSTWRDPGVRPNIANEEVRFFQGREIFGQRVELVAVKMP